jgi:hypothetical protein
MGQPDFLASIGKTRERPSQALPDLREAGGPSTVVDQMNPVLWEELDGSGVFRMILPFGFQSNQPTSDRNKAQH